MGIGFAIPTSLAIPIVKSVEREGRVTRPWLGIEVVSVNNEIAHELGLSYPYGILVQNIYPGGSADQAGIKRGDFIASFDGKRIVDDATLDYLVATSPLGKEVEFLVFRKGIEKKIRLCLEEPLKAKDSNPLLIKGRNPLQGASVQDLSPALALEMGVNPMKQGVVISNLSETAPATQLGIEPGDILFSINKNKIRTKEEAITFLKKAAPDWTINLLRRGEILTFRVRE